MVRVLERARKSLALKDPEKTKASLREVTALLSSDDTVVQACEVLMEAFTSPYWMVREYACVLMSNASARVLDFLERKVGSASPEQAYWMIRVAARYGNEAYRVLEALRTSSHKLVRKEAIQALEKLDTPEILDSLIDSLNDPVWVNRSAAASVLEKKAGSLPVIDALQKALVNKKSDNVTFWILRIISRLVGADPNNPVHTFLKHPNVRIKCAALAAMGNMIDEASLPILVAHLDDPSWIVRKAAADALLERGEQAVEVLKKAFKEGSHEVKYWAIRLMARIGGAERLNTYRSFVQGQIEELKYYGMTALSEIREANAVSVLIDCFMDKSWNVRRFASERLVSMGSFVVPYLVDRISSGDENVRYWCVRTLTAMQQAAASSLVALLESDDEEVRGYVLMCLEPPLERQLLEAVIKRLDDPLPVNQKKASDLLEQCGAAALPVIFPACFASNVNVRYWARRLTAALGEDNLDRLLEAADADDTLQGRAIGFMKTTPVSDILSWLGREYDEMLEFVATSPSMSGGIDELFSAGAMAGLGEPAPSGEFSRILGVMGGGASSGKPSPSVEVVQEGSPAARMYGSGTLDELLVLLHEKDGSDLHVNVGSRPVMRIHGYLTVLEEYEVLTRSSAERMLTSILTEEQKRKLERELSLDFSYEIDDVARYRVNLFRQRRGLNGVFRLIPSRIPSFEELQLPPVFEQFCKLRQGLFLVTGPTGSGKSSTLAAMIDYINERRQEHIITIEDPIEFVHEHKKCLISQRELGQHCRSFSDALRSALREDPDIILVGEMRDLETISLAITAAETGHLVLTTLHTTSAAQTIDRIIDVYPPHQQAQIRVQLANSVQAIVAQRLLPTRKKNRRVPVHEILVKTPAVANLIREGKTEQIFNILQTGRDLGMQTMDDALARMVRRGIVRYEDAVEYAYDKQTFEKLKPRDEGAGEFAGGRARVSRL